MAGVLNFTSPPSFRPPHLSRRLTISTMGRISVRVSAEVSDTPSSSSTSVKGEPPKLGLESISPPSNFKAPKPKRFTPRPDKIVDILGASLALFFRFGAGVFVSGYSASFVSKNEIPTGQYALEFAGVTVKETSKLGPRPEKPIEIYEFESCPFCRKVREIVAVLDLDVLYYPCPRNGPNFRPKAAQMGGKKQFPYMVDPNTGVAMYESDDIIRYLFQKYGDGNVPFQLSLGLLTTLTAGFAMIARMGKGSIYTRSKLPPKPLELWAYEPSPFCKVVREVLVELELPHILHREIKPRAFYVISPMEEQTVRSIFDAIFIMGHLKTVSLCFKAQSCARGSPKRQLLFEKLGHFQVPYLEDPNTGIGMFESAEIEEYLRATYAL